MSTPRRPRSCGARVALSLTAVTAASLLSLGASCKVTKPTSDNTPPKVTWHVVRRPSNAQLTFSPSGTVHVPAGESLAINCTVEDPQGVQKISLGGGGAYTCLNGDIGQTTNFDLASDVQNLHPNANNEVLTKIFLLKTVNPDDWTCKQGYSFSGGSLTLICTGENYFGGVTTGQLTISRP